MAWVGLVLGAVSTVMSMNAQEEQGQAAAAVARRKQQEANFEAAQLDQDAGQAKAVSQRQAEGENLQAKLINSTALARAAASGAGASDPTVLNILAKTSATGAYRGSVAMYEGEEQARLDRMRAAALRFSGDVGIADAVVASRAANSGAMATLFAGGAKGASMYSKYWSSPGPSSGGGPGNPGSLEGGNTTPTSDFTYNGTDSGGGPAYG